MPLMSNAPVDFSVAAHNLVSRRTTSHGGRAMRPSHHSHTQQHQSHPPQQQPHPHQPLLLPLHQGQPSSASGESGGSSTPVTDPRQLSMNSPASYASVLSGGVPSLSMPSPIQRVAHPSPGSAAAAALAPDSMSLPRRALEAVLNATNANTQQLSPKPLWLEQQSRAFNLPIFEPLGPQASQPLQHQAPHGSQPVMSNPPVNDANSAPPPPPPPPPHSQPPQPAPLLNEAGVPLQHPQPPLHEHAQSQSIMLQQPQQGPTQHQPTTFSH